MKALQIVTALVVVAVGSIWLFDRYQAHAEWERGAFDRTLRDHERVMRDLDKAWGFKR